MKNSIRPITALLILVVLVACQGSNSSIDVLSEENRVATIVASTVSASPIATLSEENKVATIVASTLSAAPTSTPVPAATIITKSWNLEDFENKELVGEDERYAVYLINPTGGDAAEKTGEIIIYDKSQEVVVPIIGTFILFGTPIVSNDGKGEYILLSTGTYTSRTATVISLIDKKQAVNNFCISSGEFGDHLFWNDYVIYNNCDTFDNRPWGAGEAPSVTAVHLKQVR